jgi:predicted Ser/Thr protein kinase
MMKVGLAAQTVEAGPGGTQVVPPQPKPPPTLAEVAQLFPQLEILECLGCGGMGAVYKARQPRLDRLVALKILTHDREDATHDARFAERFEREARALAKLSHPNIVAMYEFGQVEGLPYFIMEHVDGLNLRQLEQAGKLSPREALQIVPQICEALQFAHDEGIVHRDIKPENILLDKKGRVKIADFGIAKILGKEGDRMNLTAEQVIGTPHYMAPEQVEHPQRVDHRADIYSLGVVFYEMLTGELPLGKFAPPSKKVQVDVRLDEVVLHALEKEPERRYQHASDVKTDLETFESTAAPAATIKAAAGAPPHLERVENARRLVRWPATGLMAIGLCFPVVAGFFFAFGHWPANWQDALGFCCMGVIDYVILLGSWKMRRLQDYRLAVLAAIVSLVITLPGLPLAAFPIWALMVLYRPDVRAAFCEVARRTASPGFRRLWREVAALRVLALLVAAVCFAIVIALTQIIENDIVLTLSVAGAASCLLAAYRYWKWPRRNREDGVAHVGPLRSATFWAGAGTILSIAILVWLAAPKFPDYTMTGTVTDSETGKPLPNATVAVLRVDEVVRQCKADSRGHYKLVWPRNADVLSKDGERRRVELVFVASAPGYESSSAGQSTTSNQGYYRRKADFRLRSASAANMAGADDVANVSARAVVRTQALRSEDARRQ